MVKDYGMMRWLGANSYRTSHYPYSEEEMQLADREGFLIISEIPAVNLRFDNESEMDERLRMCCQQINELVARDKNHPSVIMWSVANEPQPPNVPSMSVYGGQNATIDSINKQGKSFLDALIRYTRQQDCTRLVTFASVIGTPLEWHSECDLIAMNRYWGWYIYGGDLKRAAHMFDQELETTWDFHHKPILLSEFGAESISGMHGNPPLMWTEEYQADIIRTYLELGTSKSYVVGMHVWCFADFASVQGVMRAGGFNLKGVLTRTREPKLSASVLREFWSRELEADGKTR
jgi:beta-glucuronidase